MCQEAVRFFGFLLEPGRRSLSGNRKETIVQMKAPNTRKQQFRGFLGLAGYCCIWIKPLYEALKGPEYSSALRLLVSEGSPGFCTSLGASKPTEALSSICMFMKGRALP